MTCQAGFRRRGSRAGRFSLTALAPTRTDGWVVARAGDLELDGNWRVPGRVHAECVEGRAPNPVAARRLADFLKDSLSLLPPELPARMGLHRIRLCSRLAVDGQRRRAVVLSASRMLAYDVDLLHDGDRGDVYHELFHLVDWLDHRDIDRDDDWDGLNAPRRALRLRWRGVPTCTLGCHGGARLRELVCPERRVRRPRPRRSRR